MDWTAVVVAGIAVIPSLLAYKSARATATIVQGNGRGNVVKMIEDLQDCHQRLEGKVDDALKWQGHHLDRYHRAA